MFESIAVETIHDLDEKPIRMIVVSQTLKDADINGKCS